MNPLLSESSLVNSSLHKEFQDHDKNNTSKMTMETKMVMKTKNMMMWKMSTMKNGEDLIFCSASPPPWRAFQSSANSDWSIPLFPSLSACHNDDDDEEEEEEEEDYNWSIPLFPPLPACHGFYHLHIYSVASLVVPMLEEQNYQMTLNPWSGRSHRQPPKHSWWWFLSNSLVAVLVNLPCHVDDVEEEED